MRSPAKIPTLAENSKVFVSEVEDPDVCSVEDWTLFATEPLWLDVTAELSVFGV